MDNQWMPQEIRGKLIKSSGLKDLITFSAFFHDKSLNDPFFSDICAKCNIFKSNFGMLKPPSQAEIMFIANKKLLNIIIHSKYFHPND
jgi:hypothetical protein